MTFSILCIAIFIMSLVVIEWATEVNDLYAAWGSPVFLWGKTLFVVATFCGWAAIGYLVGKGVIS